MLTILSALLGLASSALPKLLGIYQDVQDKKHELAMTQLQLQLNAQQADANLQATIAQADSASVVAAHADYVEDIKANATVGNAFIVGLSASVRPAVTYTYMLVYIGVKIAMWHGMLHPSLPWQSALTPAQALIAVWNETDMNLFAYVVSFWFGSRGQEKGAK